MKQLHLTGEQMRRVRSYLGITQNRMAERMKISAVYLKKMEGGSRNVTSEMSRRFKDVLRLNNAEILHILAEADAE